MNWFFNKKRKSGERRLPAPDLFASYPLGGPILPYYAGQFEAVYILLHPFIRPVSIDKSQFNPTTYPSKSEIVTNCEPVTWREILKISGLENISALDIGLRSSIHGLKKEFANDELAAKIRWLYEERSVAQPNEGLIPELLQDLLFKSIQHLGHEWLWIGDEFCTERKLEWIDDLKTREAFRDHYNIFTPNKSLLLTTHWDSHFSFLCSSSKKMIEQILRYHRFEGFFCDEKTEVFWSLINQNIELSR